MRGVEDIIFTVYVLLVQHFDELLLNTFGETLNCTNSYPLLIVLVPVIFLLRGWDGGGA